MFGITEAVVVAGGEGLPPAVVDGALDTLAAIGVTAETVPVLWYDDVCNRLGVCIADVVVC